MLRRNQKFMMLATVAAIALPAAVVSAAQTNIQVDAVFRTAIELDNAVAMDFGTIDLLDTVFTGGYAEMDPEGNISYDLSVFDGSSTGTAGSVDITAGDAGENVNIFCSSTAEMQDGSGNGIGIDNIVVVAGDVTGSSAACDDMVTPGFVYEIGSGTDTIWLGARINGDLTVGTFGAGTYSTGTGGTDIEVTVAYQ